MQDLSWRAKYRAEVGGERRTRDSEPETLGLGGGGVRAVSMATLPQVLRGTERARPGA